MIDLKLLANRATIKKYDSGSVIMDEYNSGSDEIYILLIGKVELYKNYKSQYEILLDTLNPGYMFGEINVYSDSSNLYTAIATQPTTLASISRINFINLAKKNTDLFIQLMEVLCERVLKVQNKVELLNTEKIKLINEYGIDVDSFYKRMLFPKDHRTNYSIRPNEYEQYIYKQNYTCPYCHNEFDDYTILSSKLIMKDELKCDLRRKYQSFEPLWYEVLTCPHCYFSAYESIFTNTVKINKNSIANNLEIIHSGLNLNFEEPKKMDQVFTSYYLALMCTDAFENKKQLEARLWLSLYRLYGDIGDSHMEKYAAEKAYETTQNYYSECNLSNDARQTILMTLGTLARKLGNTNDAILCLSNAVREQPSKTVYRRLIEIEIDEMRNERKHNNI